MTRDDGREQSGELYELDEYRRMFLKASAAGVLGGVALPSVTENVEAAVAAEDVLLDDDGDDDLVVHFPTQDTGFDSDDEEGKLVGETYDGTPLFGTDSVKIVR